MATRDERIEMEVRLRDYMTQELKRLGLQTQKTQRTASASFMKMGKSAGRLALKFAGITTAVLGLGAGIGAIVAMFGKVSRGMDEAVQFSKAMAEVGTISEGVAGNIDHFTDSVLDLSTAFGQSELKTAKALYQTISAGITDTTEAMTLVTEASKLAVGGFAEINVVVDFLTGVLNAYGKEVSEVAHLNDVFFETVRLGKTTIPEMAKQMGAVMPIAASLGVEIEELSSMLATLTLGNIETTLATTYMRQALVAILQPTEDAQKLMARMEIRFDKATIEAEGFVGILRRMKDAFGEDVAAMQKFFPNVRSFIPVLSLAGNQWEKFLEVSEALATVNERRLSPTMRALEVAMMSAGSKMEMVGNAARQGFMQLGMGLIESITGPISSVEQLQDVAFLVRDAIAGLKPVVQGFAGIMISVFGILTKGMANFADHFFESSSEARVFAAEMGGLSSVLMTVSRGVRGGEVDLIGALNDVSLYLRSNRQDLIDHALASRDSFEAMSEFATMSTRLTNVGAPFGSVLSTGQTDVVELKDTFRKLYAKDIPQEILDASPKLREAIVEFYNQTTAQGYGTAIETTPLQNIVLFLNRGKHNVLNATDNFFNAVGSEITDEYEQLSNDWVDAQTKLGRVLESRDIEGMRAMSLDDFADVFATDWVRTSGQTDLIGKSFREMYSIFSAQGDKSAEQFITAFGTHVEGNLSLIPAEVLPVALPKWEQLMVKLADMGGETWKNTFLGTVAGAFQFPDVLPFDEAKMAALKSELARVNKEYERLNLLLGDETPALQQEKQLRLLELKMQADIAAAEIAVREGSRSKSELERSTEAIRAAYSRMRSGITGDTERIGFAWQALRLDTEKLGEKFEQIKVQATNMLVDGLTEGMLNLAKGADDANQSWKQFSRNFLNTVAMMIMRLYMMKAVMATMDMLNIGGAAVDPNFIGPPVASASANGNVFNQGMMVPYAQGGIVGGPTMFPMRGGRTGLMGEAGPEAILPLERMAGGALGVQSNGGGGTSVNISINAVDAKGVDELLVSRQDTLRNIIRQAMTESRSFRSTMMGQTRG
jgi:TP901 family phage tail tape measure protein